MKRAAIWLVMLMMMFTLASQTWAQGAVVRKAAEEVIEAVAKRGGREAAEELATFGGERAVRELLEQTLKEGGEELVERATKVGVTHGLDALRVMQRSPKLWVEAIERLPEELVGPALRAGAREPVLVTRLLAQHGDEVLELAARHPGVGTQLAEKLGKSGIDIGRGLTTDQAIVLTRHADDIVQLAPGPRGQVMDKLRRSPGAVLGFLEKHPRVLLTAAGVGLVLAVKDDFMGAGGDRIIQPDGTIIEPAQSFGERVLDQFTTKFREPIWLIFGVVGVLLLGWGSMQLWHMHTMKRIKQAIAASKVRTAPQDRA